MAQKVRTLKPILAYPNKMIAQLRLQIDRQLVILGLIKAVIPQELTEACLALCVEPQQVAYIHRLRQLGFTIAFSWQPYPRRY